MANRKISELPAAGGLTGVELVEAVKGGVNVQTTTQDIADLGGGGSGVVQTIVAGTNITVDDTDPANPIVSASGGGGASDWGDLGGTLSDQTDLQAALDLKASLASPTFTGTPSLPTGTTAVTQTSTDSSTKLATTAFVQANLAAAKSMVVAVTDEFSNISTGTAKLTFRMPYAMTLTSVRASLNVAQASGSIFTVDINEGVTSILSTKLTIDNTATTSVGAATPAVISDATLADNAVITVDVDQIGNGSAIGLKITLIGT